MEKLTAAILSTCMLFAAGSVAAQDYMKKEDKMMKKEDKKEDKMMKKEDKKEDKMMK